MKKILIIVFALLSVNATAQIQTKFWGLELSSFYQESLETLKIRIADKCQYAMVVDGGINAIDGRFGGYYWDFVRFSFCGGKYGKEFYQVYFVSSTDAYASAIDKYDGLLNTLTEKYGKPIKSDNNQTSVTWFNESRRYVCSLSLNGPSTKGEKPWSVYLTYADVDVLKVELDKEQDEL